MAIEKNQPPSHFSAKDKMEPLGHYSSEITAHAVAGDALII